MTIAPTLGMRTTEEIATQPATWARGTSLAEPGTVGLPRRGERVLVIGCGTSFYMAGAYAVLREEAGHGETDARVASELLARRRRYDRVIALSRSGTSAEVVAAVKGLGRESPVTAVVGVPDSPVASLSTNTIELSFADEESVVQTRFATTALAMLRASLGEDLAPTIHDARLALVAELPPFPRQQLVVLASGWATAIAQEAALKCRESAAAWVEAYPSGEYRHGPIAVASEDTLVWALTPLTGRQREAVRLTGARLEEGRLDPLAELIRLQRFAVAWAAERGRDADHPSNLTRSVTDV